MSKYWNTRTSALEPYVPGEQPKDRAYIKLNTNENPYPPSPRVLEAIRGAADADLRLYPDPNADALRQTIADHYGVSADEVFVGNGSDEVLAFVFAGLFRESEPVLFPDITYSFYPVYARLYGLRYETVPVDDEFRIPLEAFQPGNGGIIIPNPNAPTALYEPVERFRALLERNPDSVVAVDEAYVDFGGDSAIPLVRDYPNLLVVQTLSKSRSLAGLRLGFAIGHPDLIQGLNRIKNSFNSYPIDRLALAGAAAAIADRDYFERTRALVIATRERTVAALRGIGFRVVDSSANFVLATHPDHDAGELFRQLKERGVLVRYFKQPRIDRYLRISIGTDEEMDTFLATLRDIVG